MTTADAPPTPSPEAAVGILEYASPGPGFAAILKHRFTDFCVSELHRPSSPSTNNPAAAPVPVGLPPRHDARAEAAAVDAAAKAARAAEDAALVSAAAAKGEAGAGAAEAEERDPLPAAAATLARLTTADAAAAVRSMLDAALADASSSPPPVDLPPLADKAARAGVHAWARATAAALPALAGRLETATVAAGDGGASVIRVIVWPPGRAGGGGGGGGGGRGRGRGKKRGRDSGGGGGPPGRDPRNAAEGAWPGGRAAPYCHFTLVKTNMETGAALGALARAAGARPDAFAVAGTKDKRGVTAQRVSAFRLSASALASAAARAAAGSGSGRLRVGHFSYEARPLFLGDAAGNAFRLVLRGLAPPDAPAADAAAAALGASAGFINYFGLQRFGTGGAPTHAVGAALAAGRWEAAARLILAPRPDRSGGGSSGGSGGRRDQGDAAKASFLAGSCSAASALAALPRSATAERALLAALGRAPADWAGALGGLPRPLKSLYTHALQAALWNAAASARAAAGGRGGAGGRALEGDLVVVGGRGGDDGEDGGGDEDGGAGGEEVEGGPAPARPVAGPRALPPVHAVTADEACDRAYSAADVVLPLPGWATWPPPPGPGADAARGAARALGLDLDALFPGPAPPAAPPAGRAWLPGARGGYRRLFHVPEGGLACAWLAHAGPDEELLVPEGDDGAGVGPLTPAAVPWAPGDPLPAGTAHAALALRFRLPPSGYATMVVRELTKQSTAAPPPQQQAQPALEEEKNL